MAYDDATPASFYAHQTHRGMYEDINADGAKCGFNFLGGAGTHVAEKSKEKAEQVFDNYRANGFTDDSALQYIELLEKRELTPFVYRIDDNKLQTFHKPLSNDMQRDFKRLRENTPYKDFILVDSYREPLLDRPPLFILVIDRFDRLETAAAEIGRAGKCSIFCYRDNADNEYGNLEIYPQGVSKASTTQQIVDSLNPWEVVAFGDNLNDLPLFRLADRRYAPKNAMDEVKRQATAIIPDNNHDGVARFLYRDYLQRHNCHE